MSNQTLFLICLENYPILKQLKLEEQLLRTTTQNWCVINEGSPPAIIFGISGNPPDFVKSTAVQTTKIPLIRRYSGGGTVIVDQGTFFISFIFQKEMHTFPCYPEPILRWSEEIYKKSFSIPHFQLCENDYVIKDCKCGGNAQYIQKHRFVHHTTFLWDYDPKKMDYLLLPKKIPSYRQKRPHQDFLCRLKPYFPSKKEMTKVIKKGLSIRYTLKEVPISRLETSSFHRQSTTLINWEGKGCSLSFINKG